MSRYIRLRGLPWQVTPEEIEEFLKGVNISGGTQGIHLVTSKADGKNTGEAFVLLESELDEEEAFKHNKETLGHRYIEIFSASNEEAEYAMRKPSRLSTVVKMRGLPYTCKEDMIMEFFNGLEIKRNRLLLVTDRRGRATGEAYVQFVSKEDTENALKRNREKIGHRYIELFRSSLGEMRRQTTQRSFGPYDKKDRGAWRGGDRDFAEIWASNGGGGNNMGGGNFNNGGGGGGRFNGGGNNGGSGIGGGGGGGFGDFNNFGNNRGGGGGGGGGGLGLGNPFSGGNSNNFDSPFNSNRNSGGLGNFGGGNSSGPIGGGNSSFGGGSSGGGFSGGNSGGGGGNFGSNSGGSSFGGGNNSIFGNGGGGGMNDNMRSSLGNMGGGGGFGPVGGGRNDDLYCVHMRGLPYFCFENDVYRFFEPLRPLNVKIIYNNKGLHSGTADAYFDNKEEAMQAMKKHREQMGSRYIELFFDGLTNKGGFPRRI